MKKLLLALPLLLLLAAFVHPGAAQAEKAEQKAFAKYIVLIDPAHGGDDPGVKLDGKTEKDLVLALALGIKTELMKYPNIEVQLTRNTDKKMTIQDRINLGRKVNPHIFLSLHVNAGFGKNASGYEVYFPGFKSTPTAGGESAAIISDMTKNRHLNEAVRFSRFLQKHLEQVFPRKWRDLREAPFVVFEGINFPAVTVELGFATNAEDQKKLNDKNTQAALVHAIAKSISDFSL